MRYNSDMARNLGPCILFEQFDDVENNPEKYRDSGFIAYYNFHLDNCEYCRENLEIVKKGNYHSGNKIKEIVDSEFSIAKDKYFSNTAGRGDSLNMLKPGEIWSLRPSSPLFMRNDAQYALILKNDNNGVQAAPLSFFIEQSCMNEILVGYDDANNVFGKAFSIMLCNISVFKYGSFFVKESQITSEMLDKILRHISCPLDKTVKKIFINPGQMSEEEDLEISETAYDRSKYLVFSSGGDPDSLVKYHSLVNYFNILYSESLEPLVIEQEAAEFNLSELIGKGGLPESLKDFITRIKEGVYGINERLCVLVSGLQPYSASSDNGVNFRRAILEKSISEGSPLRRADGKEILFTAFGEDEFLTIYDELNSIKKILKIINNNSKKELTIPNDCFIDKYSAVIGLKSDLNLNINEKFSILISLGILKIIINDLKPLNNDGT